MDYYQLLGVEPGEKDPEVIAKAARRQTAKARDQQDGPQAEKYTRMLKEIGQAKATLLDPVKRKQYDAQLRKDSEAEDRPEKGTKTPKRGDGPTKKRKSARDEEESEEERRSWLFPIVGSAAALVLIGGATAFWFLVIKKGEAPQTGDAVALASATKQDTSTATSTEKEKGAPTKSVAPSPPVEKPPVVVPVKPAPAVPVVPATLPPDPKPAPKAAKLTVPDKAALTKAELAIRETYKTDYAKTQPADKLALAGKLLQPGRENRQDPAAWYVLLREARDLAVEGNGHRLAVEAINDMDQWFVIDALEMKVKALTTISQAAGNLPTTPVAHTAMALADRGIDEDNYDASLRLLQVAESSARKPKENKKQLEVIEARKREVEDLAKDYQKVTAARTKLRQVPDDAEANLVVGKHLCFFQGKWEEGLPHLAKAGDAAIKAAAQQDLARPAVAKAQMAVADAWWNLADDQKGRKEINPRRRSKIWYERAGPTATDLEKFRVVDRIKQVEDMESGKIARLLPGSFYGRGMEDRVLLMREGGGNMRSEQAIERGLEWLALHQADSGMWSNHAFHTTGKCNCGDAGQKFDIAGTAFGLLPFLGAGNTHLRGPYAKTVNRGLTFLLSNQKEAGHFSDNMYENALAAIAVCEAYGVSGDARLRVPAQAAVNYIIKAQNTQGGWGYSPGAKGADTSVSGWQFAALKAGVYAGLAVPPAAFQRLSGFLDTTADPTGLGYGYNAPGAGRSTSAVGLLCRQFLGWGPGHPAMVKGIGQLFQPHNFPNKDNLSIYFIFYATQVTHHVGGKTWESWNPRVRDLLIDIQDQGKDPTCKHQKGSWSPTGDDYATQGGRLMFTSLALLTLEVYYYHIPLYGYGPAVLLD